MSTLMVTSDGNPGVIVDTNGVGSVLNEISFFSIGEGVRVSNGRFATSISNLTAPIRIYTWTSPTTFTQVALFAGGNPTPGYGLNVNNDFFWGFFNIAAANASFYKFNDAGVVVSGPIGPVPTVSNGTHFCVNNAETIAYYVDSLNNDIKRWDLSLNIAMSNLVTGFNANWICDGLFNVAASTDIIAIMNNAGGAGNNSRLMVRYNSTGAVVFSVTFLTVPAPSIDNFEEAARGVDGSYIWTRNAGAPSWDITVDCLYQKILVADGSVAASVTIPVTATPAPGSTCFLMELAAPPNLSGLYFINPGHTHDTYYTSTNKIPDPTVKCALIGE